jgi:hypothetical protein
MKKPGDPKWDRPSGESAQHRLGGADVLDH